MGGEAGDRGTADRGTATALDHRQAELDAQIASISALSNVANSLKVGELTGDPIGALLLHVERAIDRFESAPGPLTQQVLAADLLEAYRVLRERERKARRSAGGELLKEVRAIGGVVTWVPWTATLPKRLEDIGADLPPADIAANLPRRPFFSADSVRRWLVAVSFQAPAAPVRGQGRRRATPQRPFQPVDSTGLHAYNITFVKRGGTRQALPWPLAPMVIADAYKIDLVKGPGMSFLTRAGRIKIIAYLLEVVAETSTDGAVYSEVASEYVDPEALATVIVETAEMGVGRVLFEGSESAFKLFESAGDGYGTDFIITDELITILSHYTDIKYKFRHKDKAEKAKGCGSIEWITELFKDVPYRYREMWVQDHMMMAERTIYPDNLRPGMVIPAQMFLTKKTADALGGEQHLVVFVGSFTANDRIIKTEDGRVWLIKERERNLQTYCQAVMEMQGLLTLSFILCSAVGAVLGGPLVSFLLTAGDIAIDINEAGGIRKFLKNLKDNPLKAGWFMLNLVTIVGDVKGMRGLLMNPTATLEASMNAAEAAAKANKALPAAGQTADTAATEARLADSTSAVGQDAKALDRASAVKGADATAAGQDAKAATRANDAPATGGRPATDARAAKRPNEPPPAADTAPRAKPQPDKEITATDDVKAAAAKAGARDVAATVRKRPRPTSRRGGAGRGDIRQRRPKGRGEIRRGTRGPGAQPLRGNARRGRAAGETKDALKDLVGTNTAARTAAERLERLNAGPLARDIAEEFAENIADGRKMLARMAAMTDDEIRGFAAVRKALIKEPVVRGSRGFTSEMSWMDLLHLPDAPRRELTTLIGRIEPFVESGLSKALSRALETGAYSIQGGLGHFHAAAHIVDEYKAIGVKMVMEEPIVTAQGLREVDIRATVGNALRLDIEVKTYLGRLVVHEHVQKQIVRDLINHVDDSWEGLRYLFNQQVGRELSVFKQAIVDAFTSPAVQQAVKKSGMDVQAAFDTLLRRLDDERFPMVGEYLFSVFK